MVNLKTKLQLLTSRFNRRWAFSLVAGILAAAGIMALFSTDTSAGWFDDAWQYRRGVNFTHNAVISSPRRVTITVNTSALIAADKMQADCADTRFTDINGALLAFQLVADCDTITTTYDVVFPTITNGTNPAYIYYGNPTATTAGQDVSGVTSLSPSGGSPSVSSEEKGPTPATYWKFDEGYGVAAHDSSNQAHGIMGTPPPVTIEQQINLVEEGSASSTSTVYAGSNVGMLTWTAASYPGATVYFEAIILNESGSTTTAGLLDLSNNVVTDSEVTTTSTSYVRVRSTPITLNDATTYAVKIKSSTNGHIARIKVARLIIVQTDTEKITATETHVSISGSNNSNSTSYTAGSNTLKLYQFAADVWDPAPTVYFEGVLINTNGASTTYAAIHEMGTPSVPCGAEVSGSEISSIGTTQTLVRSGPISLAHGKEYIPCIKVSADTGTLHSARLVFVQSAAEGITALETVQQYITSATTVTAATYTSQEVYNYYDPGNFTGGTFTKFFETSMQIGFGAGTSYARLYNTTDTTAINDAELTTALNFIGRYRSPDITAQLPSTAKELDTQVQKLASGDIRINSSRLLIRISDLMTPEVPTRPVWQPESMCVVGSCIAFDGTLQRLTVQQRSAINLDAGLADGFSIQAWVRANSDGQNNVGQIFWKGDDTYLRTTNAGSDGLADLEARVDLSGSDATVSVADAITLNRWHHVAMVYTGATVTLYVDGHEVGASTNGSGSTQADTNHLYVGGADSAHFHGFVDEFKIYNRARTLDEIKTDFTKLSGPHGSSAVFGGSKSFLSDGQVGYWKMDDNVSGNGQTVLDHSGNDNHGTTNNGGNGTGMDCSATGKYGGGCEFDGTDDVINAGSASSLDNLPANGLTVSAWIYPDNVSQTRTIMAKEGGGTDGWSFRQISADLSFIVPGDSWANARTNSVLTQSQWHHVLATYDHAARQVRIFVNGSEVSSYAQQNIGAGALSDDSTFDLRFGYRGWDAYFDGRMDEMRVYKRVLSSTEVSNLYNWAPEPVAHWKFDEPSGNAYDSSAHNNHLTNVNGAVYVPGRFGNAAGFSPEDSHYQYIGTSDELSITGDLSIAAWIKPESVAASTQFNIAGKWDNANQSYLLSQYEDEIRLYLGSESDYVATTDVGLTTGQWYHVQASYHAASQLVEIYVNGVPRTTSTTGTIPTSLPDNAGRFHVSAQDSTSSTGQETVQVAAGTDDSHENANSAMPNPGAMNINMGNHTSATSRWLGGMRWSVDIPQGSTIQAAHISVYATSDDPHFDIHAQAADDAAAFTSTTGDISGRPRTTASVRWDATNLGTSIFIDSPDISAVIQEVVDRPGWVAGNNLVIVTVPDGSVIQGLTARPYDFNTALAPILHVEFANIPTKNFYDGLIDDVRIYNYFRSGSHVIEDMNAGHPAPGSPVGSALIHWKLDENGGTNVNNSGNGGSALMGTLSRGTWPTGCVLHGCVEFSSDGSVILNDPSFTDSLTEFTSSMWIRPTSLTTDSALIAKSTFVNNDHALLVRTDATNPDEIRVYIGSGSSTSDYFTTTNFDLTTSAWYHLTVVYNGSASAADRIKVYKNGLPVTGTVTGTIPSSMQASTTANFTIGDTNIGGVEVNDGLAASYDEIKFYTQAFSADQVKVEHNQGFATTLGTLSTSATGQADSSRDRKYCPPGNTETNCAAGLNASPTLEWTLDDNTGTSTVMDTAGNLSGNPKSGTMNGMTDSSWVSGVLGSALSFDGSDDYLSHVDHDDLDFTADVGLSLEAWIKHDTASAVETIISKYETTGNDGGYQLFMESNGEITCRVYRNNTLTGSDFVTSTGISYDDNQWHHVVCTKQDVSPYVALYVDGVLVGTDTVRDMTQSLSNNDPFYVGRNGDAAAYWTGQIDNVAIYRYARTQAQIAWSYNRGAPVGWWRFDECSGTIAYDASGNGNNGTITPGDTSGSNDSVGSCSGSTGEMWFDGKEGKRNASLEFDGTNDHVDIPSDVKLGFESAFQDYSIFAWVKRASFGDAHVIIDKRDSGADGWSLMVQSSNLVTCSRDATIISSTSTIADNQWHHVGCTIDRGGNGQVYIDGKADGPPVAVSAVAMSIASDIRIGNNSYGTTGPFHGQIDDVRVYNYVLSENQIRDIINYGAVRFGP